MEPWQPPQGAGIASLLQQPGYLQQLMQRYQYAPAQAPQAYQYAPPQMQSPYQSQFNPAQYKTPTIPGAIAPPQTLNATVQNPAQAPAPFMDQSTSPYSSMYNWGI